jgi:pantetheine-phosphate adenylyltransferase
MTERIAVYPGTFDPVTNGHLDVIGRAARLVDRLVVGVAINIGKGPLFDLEERVDLVRAEVAPIATRPGTVIEVRPFQGLLVHSAREIGARMIIRGLRAVSDFDYEFQLAWMNRKLDPNIETVFLCPNEDYFYVNSTLVKEIARLGGDIEEFVPPGVRNALARKLKTA